MWKRTVLLALVLLLTLLLQATVVSTLGWFLNYLDLFLVLTSVVALLSGPKEGALFGLIAGLVRDVALGFGLGFYALPLFVVGYGIGHFSRVVFRDSYLVPWLAGIGSCLAFWLILTISNGFLYNHWLFGRSWSQLPIMLLINSLFVPLLYALLSQQTGVLAQSRGN